MSTLGGSPCRRKEAQKILTKKTKDSAQKKVRQLNERGAPLWLKKRYGEKIERTRDQVSVMEDQILGDPEDLKEWTSLGGPVVCRDLDIAMPESLYGFAQVPWEVAPSPRKQPGTAGHGKHSRIHDAMAWEGASLVPPILGHSEGR